MTKSNPFAAGMYYGVPTFKVSAADRMDAVRTFDRAQCAAALQLPDLQKSVVHALRARVRALDRAERDASGAGGEVA